MCFVSARPFLFHSEGFARANCDVSFIKTVRNRTVKNTNENNYSYTTKFIMEKGIHKEPKQAFFVNFFKVHKCCDLLTLTYT
jgi:hypothetical protein